MKGVGVIICLLLGGSCVHPKLRFQKAGVLDPMMDPAKTGGLLYTLGHTEVMKNTEKGASSQGGSIGATCPTCGG